MSEIVRFPTRLRLVATPLKKEEIIFPFEAPEIPLHNLKIGERYHFANISSGRKIGECRYLGNKMFLPLRVNQDFEKKQTSTDGYIFFEIPTEKVSKKIKKTRGKISYLKVV